MASFRPIEPSDNAELASVIRKSLEGYGLNIPGTVYTDPTTDHLHELFRTPGSVYFVATDNGRILGGCGIFPTKGLPSGYAELVKLYLREEVRGKGIGKKLMEMCITWSVKAGYTHLYLETFAELASAVVLYEKLGFRNLPGPLGQSGHDACPVWMDLELVTIRDFGADSDDYEKSLTIRKKVFIDEQKIDPALELEFENDCRYFLVSVGVRPVSTGRVRVSGDKIKFERFATLPDFRGAGTGKILLRSMIRYVKQNHPDKTPYLHAQLSAAGFYEKSGWKRKGEIFHEAGIPHVAMIYPA